VQIPKLKKSTNVKGKNLYPVTYEFLAKRMKEQKLPIPLVFNIIDLEAELKNKTINIAKADELSTTELTENYFDAFVKRPDGIRFRYRNEIGLILSDGTIRLITENEDLLKDEFLGDEAVPERVEAEESSGEFAELPLEEALEPSSSEAEFDVEPVTEALEALDLSSLEAELYPELEALEAEERAEAEGIEGC